MPANVLSMAQIELFNHLRRIILISYLKPYTYAQSTYFTKECLINKISDVKQ